MKVIIRAIWGEDRPKVEVAGGVTVFLYNEAEQVEWVSVKNGKLTITLSKPPKSVTKDNASDISVNKYLCVEATEDKSCSTD